MIKFLNSKKNNFDNLLDKFLTARKTKNNFNLNIVKKIIKDIKKNGDKSLIKYEKKFSKNKSIKPSNLEIKKNISKLNIDVNAIAKGYAVDVVHNWLVGQGFTNVFVEIGGEIRCLGVNKAGKPWVVGIDTPSSVLSSGPG